MSLFTIMIWRHTNTYIKDDHESLNMSQHETCLRKSQSSSGSRTISIDELTALGITFDSQLNLLAVQDDGFEVYSILNVDKSRMICALIRHPDRIIDIRTREEEVFHYCNPRHLAWILLSRLRRGLDQNLSSMSHSIASGAINLVIATVKLFVVITYISARPIAFLAHDWANNCHWL